MTNGAPRIEDHALIGDMRTAALVTKDGSIDWLCLPAFDSDACFAALVGTADNGHWKIAPTVPVSEVRRRYRKDTLILETDFVTETGTVRLVDFMPPRQGRELLSGVPDRPVHRRDGAGALRDLAAFRVRASRASRRRRRTARRRCSPAPTRCTCAAGPASGAALARRRVRRSPQGRRSRTRSATDSRTKSRLASEDVAQAERATEEFWTGWCATLRAALALPRHGGPLADHAQGVHLRADGRHRRCAHHVAARDPGRRAQLGLSLLLAARRGARAPRADSSRACGRRRGRSSTGCCGPSPGTRLRCRSCTASGASAASPRWSSTGSTATRAPSRCASATPPTTSASSTSSASWRR